MTEPTESESWWWTQACPTHRCTICGAFWRLWDPRDLGDVEKGHSPHGFWNLASKKCGQCCDNVAMDKQIVRATLKDVWEFILKEGL